MFYTLLALSATAKPNLDPGKETSYKSYIWWFEVPPEKNVIQAAFLLYSFYGWQSLLLDNVFKS